MEVATAQSDIAAAYVGGAPGVFVSGVAWLAAGIVERSHGPLMAFAVLFVGGMLIMPISILIGRFLFGAGNVSAGNPLHPLGIETTVTLFAGVLIAYALLRVGPALAFPALAVTIGARYFAFRTLYGEPLYWALGALLAAIGTVAIVSPVRLPLGTLLLVGITECAFAVLLLLRWWASNPPPAAPLQQ